MTSERQSTQANRWFIAPPPAGAHRSELLLLEALPSDAEPLLFALGQEGYVVTWVRSVDEVLLTLRAHRAADLIIVDRGTPEADGLEAIRDIRAEGYIGPIILVSGRASELDLVHGLDSGADDYLAKPYGLAELSARIRAALRRSAMWSDDSASGRVIIDPAAHRAVCDGLEIKLSRKEFSVLTALVSAEGAAVPREELLREVWGDWFGSPKTLDVAVSRLRQKLARAGARDQITAVRGVGFRLDRAH